MGLPKKLPPTLTVKRENRTFANRYQLCSKIGSGNFGTAYLVNDNDEVDPNEQKKVLKQIFVGMLNPGESVSAMHEAQLLSSLKHDNIVQFHSSFLEGQFFCIITEFCEGGDLEDKIQEKKKNGLTFQESQVVEWLVQLLAAIKYMHERWYKRILHRDLKTRNIFVKNNAMKIGDFGISKILMGTSDMASTFVGTPYYMSPEVLKHEQYDEKCDIWSMGCVLYEMCCLEHAFAGATLMSVMVKIVSEYIPSLSEMYSRGLNNVLERLLDRNPLNRPTAVDILKHPRLSGGVSIPNVKLPNRASPERVLTPKEKLELRKKKQADKRFRTHQKIAKQNYENNIKRNNEMKKRLHQSSLQPSLQPVPAWQKFNAVNNSPKLGSPFEEKGGLDNFSIEQRASSKSPPYGRRSVSKSPPKIDSKSFAPSKKNKSRSPLYGRRSNSQSPSNNVNWDETPVKTHQGDVISNQKQIRSISVIDPPKNIPEGKHKANKSESQEFISSIVMNSSKEDPFDLNSTQELIETLVKDGDIPEDALLAESYYSMHEDFETDTEEDGEITDVEYNEMLGCMQDALDLEESTIVASTFSKAHTSHFFGIDVQNKPNSHSKVEGPQLIQPLSQSTSLLTQASNRITNLRKECIKNLGQEKFDKLYEFLNNNMAKEFNENHQQFVSEITKIVSDPKDSFKVEQLIFLEQELANKSIK